MLECQPPKEPSWLIIDEMTVNPKYYEQMSALLDALIEQRRKKAVDYLLDVKECNASSGVSIVGKATMQLRVPPSFDRAQREAVLQRWYRRQMRALLG